MLVDLTYDWNFKEILIKSFILSNLRIIICSFWMEKYFKYFVQNNPFLRYIVIWYSGGHKNRDKNIPTNQTFLKWI